MSTGKISAKQQEILEYIKERTKDNDLYIKRLSDIVLNKKIDDNIKYLVFRIIII